VRYALGVGPFRRIRCQRRDSKCPSRIAGRRRAPADRSFQQFAGAVDALVQKPLRGTGSPTPIDAALADTDRFGPAEIAS
jgi:hypothetical protein